MPLHICILNEGGNIVQQYWQEIPDHYPNVDLDEFIVMPNHMQGILIFNKRVQNIVGVQNIEPLHNKYQKIIPGSLGSIIRGYKIGVTKWFRKNTNINMVWQRNYYDHIIRNEKSLRKIRQYIINNPVTWPEDRERFCVSISGNLI